MNIEERMMGKTMIYGIPCQIIKWRYVGEKSWVTAYRFTVPGWKEATITGIRAARRTIEGRLNPAIRNTFGIS